MVDRGGRVVLLDFGLITDVARPGGGVSDDYSVVGTVDYMSPEQGASLPLTPASDWYSVGTVLYRALTGTLPFFGPPIVVLMEKQRRHPDPPIDLLPETPADLSQLCVDLLRCDPQARPDGHDILRRLGSRAVPPVPRRPSGSRSQDTPLVGRNAHAEVLREAFGSATREGRAVTVLVHGRSGMGKSILIERVTRELARERSAVVLAGRCYERESVPYKALDSLIDSLSRHLASCRATRWTRSCRATCSRWRACSGAPPGRRGQGGAAPHRGPGSARAAPPRHGGAARAPRPHGGSPPARPHHRRRAVGRSRLHHAAPRSPAPAGSAVAAAGPGLSQRGGGDQRGGAPPARRPAHLGAGSRRHAQGSRSACCRRRRRASSRSPACSATAPREISSPAPSRASRPAIRSSSISWSASSTPRTVAGQAPRVSFGDVMRVRLGHLGPEARRVLELVAVAGQPLSQRVAARAAGLAGEDQVMSLLRAGSLVRTSGAPELGRVETYHDRIRAAVGRHPLRGAAARVSPRPGRRARGQRAPGSGGARGSPARRRRGRARHRVRDRGGREGASAALAFERAAVFYRLAIEALSPRGGRPPPPARRARRRPRQRRPRRRCRRPVPARRRGHPGRRRARAPPARRRAAPPQRPRRRRPQGARDRARGGRHAAGADAAPRDAVVPAPSGCARACAACASASAIPARSAPSASPGSTSAGRWRPASC